MNKRHRKKAKRLIAQVFLGGTERFTSTRIGVYRKYIQEQAVSLSLDLALDEPREEKSVGDKIVDILNETYPDVLCDVCGNVCQGEVLGNGTTEYDCEACGVKNRVKAPNLLESKV